MVPLIVGSSSHLEEHNEDNPPQTYHKPTSSRQTPSSQMIINIVKLTVKIQPLQNTRQDFHMSFPLSFYDDKWNLNIIHYMGS